MTAAEVIATNLGHLQHPTGAVVSIPGFDRTAHPDLIEAHGMLATMIGDAVINTLEQAGHVVTTPDQLRRDDEPERDLWKPALCNQCHNDLFRIALVNDYILIDTLNVGEVLVEHTKECRQ